jgi:hypothetical protein
MAHCRCERRAAAGSVSLLHVVNVITSPGVSSAPLPARPLTVRSLRLVPVWAVPL